MLAALVAGTEGLAIAAVVVGVMGLSLEAEGWMAVKEVGVLMVEARTWSLAWVT